MSEILDLPFVAAARYTIALQGGNAANPARGFEFDQVVDYASARWVLEWTLADRTTTETGVALAFLGRVSEGARFRATPPLSRRPDAYRLGTGRPWLANPAVDATILSTGPRSITVQGLAVGAVLRSGDCLSFVGSGETEPRLYVISSWGSDVIADAQGRATLRLSPRVLPASAGTPVRFDDPRGVFSVPPGSAPTLSVVPGPRAGALTFTAIQTRG